MDFVVGAWLYNRYPEMPEGDLTRMRSALVHTGQLASFARQLEMGGALRLGRAKNRPEEMIVRRCSATHSKPWWSHLS